MSDDMSGWESEDLSDSASDFSTDSSGSISDQLGGGDYSATDLDDELSTDELASDLSAEAAGGDLPTDGLSAGDLSTSDLSTSGLSADDLSATEPSGTGLDDEFLEPESGADDVYDPGEYDQGDAGDFGTGDLGTGEFGTGEFDADDGEDLVEPAGPDQVTPDADFAPSGPGDTALADALVADVLDPTDGVAAGDTGDTSEPGDEAGAGALDPATDGLAAELPHAVDADPFPPSLDPADFGGVEPADGLDWVDPGQLGDTDQSGGTEQLGAPDQPASLDADIPEPSTVPGLESLVDPEPAQALVAELAGIEGGDPAQSSDPGIQHLSNRWA